MQLRLITILIYLMGEKKKFTDLNKAKEYARSKMRKK